ncbi:putative diacylglycerol O-acyltransferase tgs1 domain protein [Mycobacterium xenopi 4042]|uniref:Putative diacylglycerol O-acyltransferase tgs1 domain protein n=1 Tax=Mycobacterium xenopi 4042 TaxID=1299334 RepID=X8DZA7_MYCXE|nr:putative diacylglycerol O-acyltransferase tgs1 domain protein [Mycobacterium xenopi 4042]
MNQLTTLDASFLHAEDADPRANLAIGGLAVIDGPIPDHDLLMSTLARRIGRCPALPSGYAYARSTWAHRNGSKTRDSISPTMCDALRYRGRVRTRSCYGLSPT